MTVQKFGQSIKVYKVTFTSDGSGDFSESLGHVDGELLKVAGDGDAASYQVWFEDADGLTTPKWPALGFGFSSTKFYFYGPTTIHVNTAPDMSQAVVLRIYVR